MNILDENINYVEKGKGLTIQAFTKLYESDFDSMWNSIPWDKITRTSLICKKGYSCCKRK